MIFANMVHQFYNLRHLQGITDNRKCWIATALGIAGSVASSLFGGNKAKKAARAAAKERTYRANAEKAWYDKAYNTDYMDTKAGQNMLRRAQEIQDEYVLLSVFNLELFHVDEVFPVVYFRSSHFPLFVTYIDMRRDDFY